MENKYINLVEKAYFVGGVLTILALLSVVVFWFMKSWIYVDNEKLELTKNEIGVIKEALLDYKEREWNYPSPDNSVWIVAGKGNFIYYQGDVSEELTNKLWIEIPLLWDYTYSITSRGDRYQVVAFVWKNKIISEWDKIGVFVDSNNIPFQDVEEPLWDLTKTEEIFTVYFDENIKRTGKADVLTPIKAVANYEYDPSLIGYWDMETITSDGKLFDLSWNLNHWELLWGMEVWTEIWTIWKSANLDGKDDFIAIDSFSRLLREHDDFTISYDFQTEADFKKYITLIWINWWNPTVDNVLRLWFWVEKWIFFSFSDWMQRFEVKKWDITPKWHNITVTYEKSNNKFRIFLDWKASGFYYPKPIEQNLPFMTRFSIGQDYDINPKTLETTSWDFYKWKVDEVLVYSRVLSPEEIEKLIQKKGLK